MAAGLFRIKAWHYIDVIQWGQCNYAYYNKSRLNEGGSHGIHSVAFYTVKSGNYENNLIIHSMF